MGYHNLTRDEFDVLVSFHQKSCCLEEFLRASSLNSPNSTLKTTLHRLEQEKWVDQQGITPEGYHQLAPYEVKRAVILAAGFGSRLEPLTLTTPKPLVAVKGTQMIRTLLRALDQAGISHITVVRGHLAEQFDCLLEEFPHISFVLNPNYNIHNNISSVYLVRGLLPNAYVIEGDLCLYTPELISKYQYTSNYLGIPVHSTTDWGFETLGTSITNTVIGGDNLDLLIGISYWTQEDGRKIAQLLGDTYEKGEGTHKFWDEFALMDYKGDFSVEVRRCKREDVIEIDTLEELKAIDDSYCS